MTEQEREQIFDLLQRTVSTRPSDEKWGKDYKKTQRAQAHGQRSKVFWIVVGLLLIEVIAMFVIVLSQGMGFWIFRPQVNFDLDKWVLAAFEGGVLLQTFGLAKIITSSIYTYSDEPETPTSNPRTSSLD